ncbi:coagulation factor IX-like [Acipenser ruthenus]|uniref:coagulation factor IX-like n=2 Tax=Acipenser ruthenus TaxID=7906 RepID=UPI00274139C4|nr:coagulation factor IX-like [Acipenser ruthenus]
MKAQLLWICLSFFSLTFIEANVFLPQESASQVFRRHKRANSIFEELKQGNLERECNEEQCSYEEVREVFQKEEPTKEFWNTYVEIPKLCQTNNGGCEHLCKVERVVTCSCVEGYKLGQDRKSCITDVFLSQESASQVFRRHKRANSFFEELKQGNLERECKEEQCSYEEAREVFEKEEPTNEFWNKHVEIPKLCQTNNGGCEHLCKVERVVTCSCVEGYKLGQDRKSCITDDGDQCRQAPCQNGGVCTDGIGAYVCDCKDGYQGQNCEIDTAECLPAVHFGCDQFCHPGSDNSYVCSCTKGYTLGANKKTCIPQVKFPCGKQTTFQFPWQVQLVNEDTTGFCSGAILGQYLVLTAAKCVSMVSTFQVVVGNQSTGHDNNIMQILHVDSLHIHPRYKNGTENDIALITLREPIQFNKNVIPICIPEKDFAEHILMQRKPGVVSRWGSGWNETKGPVPTVELPYLPLETCQEKHNFTISNKMFCTEELSHASCQLASGSPIVSSHKGIWFLTGILISGPAEYDCNQGYIFIKITRYLSWLKPFLYDHN